MRSYPHAAVGRLQSASPVIYTREFYKLQDDRQQAWDSAHRWGKVSEFVKPAPIVVAPTATMLVVAAAVVPLFPPLVVGAAIAGGAALLTSVVSKLKQKLATSRANDLSQRIAHVRNDKSAAANLDGNAPAMVGRLRDRRGAQAAGRESELQNKSRQPRRR